MIIKKLLWHTWIYISTSMIPNIGQGLFRVRVHVTQSEFSFSANNHPPSINVHPQSTRAKSSNNKRSQSPRSKNKRSASRQNKKKEQTGKRLRSGSYRPHAASGQFAAMLGGSVTPKGTGGRSLPYPKSEEKKSSVKHDSPEIEYSCDNHYKILMQVDVGYT